MKKCITDFDLNGKKVIIRVDFNVPMKGSTIEDDNRIRKSLKTINYAINNGAKVILLSHLGRVEEEKDLKEKSLKIVAIRLSELLSRRVKFIDKTRGKEVKDAINEMNNGDIILLENTRFEDYPNKLESNNDPSLAQEWASMADIFINDAFATSHRAHASNVGIATYLPSGIGFLVKDEIEAFDSIFSSLERPFMIILGGAKVKDKIGLINNLIDKASHILIGGGMAYTFLKAKGYNVGKSIVDDANLEYAKGLLDKYSDKLILPIDNLVSTSLEEDSELIDIDKIKDTDIGYDIGPKTVELFKKYLKEAKTVVWNGPMGLFENSKYVNGTKDILSALVNNKNVIICGGDTASAAINLGYEKDFKLISTGGGASLEMLAGLKMPGIDLIDEK